MKNLIIFNLDGTLLDSRMDMALSVNRIRKLYQLPEIPIEVLKSFVDKDTNTFYKNCFPEIIKETIPEDLKTKFQIHYAEHIIDNTKLYSNIQQILETLSIKNHMVLYSNKPEKLIELLLKKLQVYSLFSAILGSESFENKKPDPEKIIKVIKSLNLEFSNLFFAGNSEFDIVLAKNLNAKFIWCKWGYYNNRLEQAPDFIAKSPEELLKIFEEDT